MASSPSNSSKCDMVTQFMEMGFPKKLIEKAILDKGEENPEAILETLLRYSATEDILEESVHSSTDPDSFEFEGDFSDELSDFDDYLQDEEEASYSISPKDKLLCHFVEMGYSADDVLVAIDKCGSQTPIPELMDFICAAQMENRGDDLFRRESSVSMIGNSTHTAMPRKSCFNHEKKRKFPYEQDDDDLIHLPNPMVGFGLPNNPGQNLQRELPTAAIGPPYFYYENVALAPKGVWKTISRFLYEVQPEFVDSQFFSAAARKRGYVHNLPIQNRFPLRPIPPMTITEALPSTAKWWPSWDSRAKFNCLQTCIGSAKLSERIRKALEPWDSVPEPPKSVKKYVLEQCRKWNLVWVGRNKVAPLEPDEMEMLLGFPNNHTRGGGISRTDRYKALGNTFQLDTIGFHLSVLKERYPNGVNILSLFSGIGGAEVALHRLGVRLKNVVSVEILESSRGIISSWWEQTNQQGILIHVSDVHQVTPHKMEQWISSFGGFDLVIGGSPCNNLTGSNRHSRDGLEGEHSSLFFDYVRVLELVKMMMGRNNSRF